MEENDRRACWQGLREEAVGEEANLKTKLVDDVKGAKTRWTDMMAVVCRFQSTINRSRKEEIWKIRRWTRVSSGW